MRGVMLVMSVIGVAALFLLRQPVDRDANSAQIIGLYVVWFAGSGDDDREELDRFLDCLVNGSNLNSYWRGEARVELRGSWALPPPLKKLDWDELASSWLSLHLDTDDSLPSPRPDEVPLYLVVGGHPDLWTGACGRNSEEWMKGRRVGVGIVRNFPLCWPTGDSLRTETQIAQHEIVETVDRLLGYGACSAGDSCRGRSICEDACDTFIGLQCPGAPTGSRTGCDKRLIDGWVVQKLGYAGRDPERCESCMECDFTPYACSDGEADCGSLETP